MGYQMSIQGAAESEQFTAIGRDFGRGTTELCAALLSLGMGFLSDVPEFPENEHLDGSDFQDELPVTDRARAYLHALERTRAEHEPAYLPGIPTHKLTSGDDWHVTASECTDALDSYDFAVAAGAAHPRAFAQDFVPFLRAAAAHDGFRVN